LILYDMMSLKDLNGEKVLSVLTPFIEKASIWKEAISKGDIPAVHGTGISRPAGMFGLAP